MAKATRQKRGAASASSQAKQDVATEEKRAANGKSADGATDQTVAANGTSAPPESEFGDRTGAFDTTGFDDATIIEWYKILHLGRRLDQKAALYLKMAKGWSYHAPYAGHDGIQLAIGTTFRSSKDFLFPYYRDMLTCLSAGLSVEELILNGLSKDGDVAGGGRHMSNHFAKPEIGIQNGSSCTGNHSLHAVGTARAIKKFKGDEFTIYSGGESACSEGYFYEAINTATLEKLPVIFAIQNNKFGISVPVTEQTANTRVSDNFRGFKNLKIINCDGLDPFASYRAMQEAREYVLSGAGAAFVHADCDRIGSHSNSDNHELYRVQSDFDEMAARDPLPRYRQMLLDRKLMTEEEIVAVEEKNKELIFAAADVAEAAAEPDPQSWTQFIVPDPIVDYSDNSEAAYNHDPKGELLTFREAINTTLKEEFRRNPKTYLWGQDVASVNKQGIFNVPKGMLDEFGNERIFNAAIAEDSIVGTANGFCRYDDEIRVVVEGAEFADYFWPAMEQLIECSHDYWRTKGQFSPNITIRLASGGYIQGGLYHSQNLDAIFSHLPGLRVVCPAFASDAVGLMRSSMRSRGVTLYLEPKALYNFRPTSESKPADDYIIPFGKGKRRREGKDVTIVTYGNALHKVLRAVGTLEKAGIDAEVIDLRSLRPWDEKMVFEAVKKTNRVVVAHEHYMTGGIGGEIAAAISSECFSYLDAPVGRVASKDCPVGFSAKLEGAILLQEKDIVDAVTATAKY